MTLEHAVARAVFRARLMEHALHSGKDWSITVGDITVPANRTVLADRIVFSAQFSTIPSGDVQELDHEGIPVSGQPFVAPDFAPFIIDWTLSIVEAPIAA